MARFHGPIGYGESVEVTPGVWEDVIVERNYFGDVLRNTRKLDDGDKVNNDLSVSNSISVVADAQALNHFVNIKYIKWMGVLWTVTDVEVKSPRLILRLGEVYNGQTPPTPIAP